MPGNVRRVPAARARPLGMGAVVALDVTAVEAQRRTTFLSRIAFGTPRSLYHLDTGIKPGLTRLVPRPPVTASSPTMLAPWPTALRSGRWSGGPRSARRRGAHRHGRQPQLCVRHRGQRRVQPGIGRLGGTDRDRPATVPDSTGTAAALRTGATADGLSVAVSGGVSSSARSRWVSAWLPPGLEPA
jgi:hypothetical protein